MLKRRLSWGKNPPAPAKQLRTPRSDSHMLRHERKQRRAPKWRPSGARGSSGPRSWPVGSDPLLVATNAEDGRSSSPPPVDASPRSRRPVSMCGFDFALARDLQFGRALSDSNWFGRLLPRSRPLPVVVTRHATAQAGNAAAIHIEQVGLAIAIAQHDGTRRQVRADAHLSRVPPGSKMASPIAWRWRRCSSRRALSNRRRRQQREKALNE